MSNVRLARLFLSATPAAATQIDPDTLERELRSRIDAARAAWSEGWGDEDSFVLYLARHTRARLPAMERAADMWLACACASGAPQAIATLIALHRGAIERAAARIQRRVADETAQVVFMSLLVRVGEKPARIAAYGGECALATWLATVSARAAIKLCRGQGERPHDSVSKVTHGAAEHHPDLVLLRSRYARELDAGFRAALKGLGARQRLLLRLHHAEGWSLENLASLHGISRATVARWLAAARDELYQKTKQHVRRRLAVTSTEFGSIAELIGGELEVSVERLLQQDGDRGASGSGDSLARRGCASGGAS